MNLASIPNAVIIAVSMTAYLVCGILRNYYCKTFMKKTSDNYKYNAVTSALCALVLAAMAKFRLDISPYTVALSVFFGIITMAATVFTTMALKIGSWSFTSVIISFSTVITALSGFVVWHEPLSALKIAGIVLMSFCFVFAVKKDEEETSVSLKWFILAFAAAVTTAGVGIVQKIHQSSSHSGELTAFLIVAFVLSFALSAVFYKVGNVRKNVEKSILTENRREKSSGKLTKKCYVPALILAASGICIAFNNYFNLYLSGVVESAVLFPILNGGGLILNIIAGVVLFREHLSKMQWCGIACGVAATICLCY